MDGKNHQGIKKYVCIYLIFALLFFILFSLLAGYERSRERQRMLTLLVKHPELEAEIIGLWEKLEENRIEEIGKEELSSAIDIVQNRYGYDLKQMISKKMLVVSVIIGFFMSAVLVGCIAYMDSRRRIKSAGSEKMLHELQEYLIKIQNGYFGQIPDYDDTSGDWMKMWESARELGVYFENLKQRLEEEQESTKALITDISHQLKTPLASLRMSYELVVSEKITEEEKREFQEQELKEIKKLELLLSELVNLSRLEKRMIEIQPVCASLKETITEAVEQVYMKAHDKEIEIQVEMERDYRLCHDLKWTVEAFVNVLDNAVKYSKTRTRITVRVRPLVKNILIEIMDEGMGIRPEELVKIYHRFYRGSEASKIVKEGAGVGLYLSRMILERQGGTICAKRRQERGTVFQITLPYK